MFKKALVALAAFTTVSAQDNEFFDDAAFDAAFDNNDEIKDENDEEAKMDALFREIDDSESILGEAYLDKKMTSCLRAIRLTLVRNANQVDEIAAQLATQWSVDEDQARNAYATTLLAHCNQNINVVTTESIFSGKVPTQKEVDLLFVAPKIAQPTLTKTQNERLSRVIAQEEAEGNSYGREAMQAAPLGLLGESWSQGTKFVWMVVTFAVIFAISAFGIKKVKELESAPVKAVAVNRKQRRFNAKNGIVDEKTE